MSDPCHHRGTCVTEQASSGNFTYKCVCPSKYSGHNCDSGNTCTLSVLQTSDVCMKGVFCKSTMFVSKLPEMG